MSATNEPEATPLRREKALLMTEVAVGETLTLVQGKLIWKRSRWNWSHGFGANIGPEVLEVELSKATCLAGGRRPPLRQLLGTLIFTLEPLVVLLSGGFRKTLQVAFAGESYYFSVKAVDSWLRDIERARLAAGDVHADVRRPMTVEEAERELGAQSL